MKVLRLKLNNGKEVYIQKVTSKTICVILDENEIANFSVETGKFRGPKTSDVAMGVSHYVLSVSPVKNFFKFNRIEDCEWDGGWKPRRNKKGCLVFPDMPKLRKFKGHKNPMREWLEFQKVDVTNLNA